MNNINHSQLLMNPKIKTMTILAGLMLCLTGCEKSTRIITNAGGHEIRAVIAGNHSVDGQADRGVISSRYAKITIESARVKINDAPWAAIPAAALVELSVSKRKVILTAGPVTVRQTF
jgi:hypothetical protein